MESRFGRAVAHSAYLVGMSGSSVCCTMSRDEIVANEAALP